MNNNDALQQLLTDNSSNMVSPVLSFTPTTNLSSQSSSISLESSTALSLINQSQNLNDLSKLHTLISSNAAVAAAAAAATAPVLADNNAQQELLQSPAPLTNGVDVEGASSSSSSSSSSSNGGAALEMGVVEKVLNGYGFIKCYNREQLLFFNYPYYYQGGAVNVLKAGDLVEFEPVVDKRTGKTLATNLVRHQDKQNQQRLQQQQQLQLQHNQVITNDEANINLTRLKVRILFAI